MSDQEKEYNHGEAEALHAEEANRQAQEQLREEHRVRELKADQPELTAESVALWIEDYLSVEIEHHEVLRIAQEITALVEQERRKAIEELGLIPEAARELIVRNGLDFPRNEKELLEFNTLREAEALKREEAAIMATVNWLSDRENYPEAGETEAFIQDYLKTKKDGE